MLKEKNNHIDLKFSTKNFNFCVTEYSIKTYHDAITSCRNFSNFFLKNDDISNFCSNFSMGVYEKYILKHKQIPNSIDSKIIPHNYILY